MTKGNLPLSRVYRLIEPGPVVLVTTARKGRGEILEVVKAWIDPARKRPQTIHHLGKGLFMVAGKTIRLPSKMK
jgi:hypothetical protein